jgi:uncharacterized membrane protein YfcA
MTAGLLRDALALLLGFVTGVLSALFGIGGAIVSNPGLRILGAAPLVAVGTTLPSILPGAVSGTLRYRREGLIDWRLIIPAAAAGLLAVVGGSLLSHAVPGQGHLLLLLIAVLLAVTAWRTAFTGPTPEAEVPGAGDTREHPTPSAPGAGDNREHPPSPSATLPLRGAWHRRVGLSRAATPGPGSPAPTPGPAGSDPVASGRLARRRRWIAAGIGLSAGLLSGLLGIGAG